MNLWLLRPVGGLTENNNPWDPWHNKAFGFIVRANTEDEARSLAHDEAGDENQGLTNPWMSAKYSTCVNLTAEGTKEVVMCDFSRA